MIIKFSMSKGLDLSDRTNSIYTTAPFNMI